MSLKARSVSRSVRVFRPAGAATLLAILLTTGCANLEPRANSEQRGAADANADLGLSYLQAGEQTAARRSLERALEFDPDHNNALLGMAGLEELENNDEEAERLYRRILANDSRNAYALTNLGTLICRERTPTEALPLLQRGVDAAPADVRDVAMANLGLCQLRNGEVSVAEERFRSVLSRDSENVRALLGMAEVSMERDEPMGTRAFLSRLEGLGVVSARMLDLCVQAETALNNERRADECRERRRRSGLPELT